jgi:F-type H+-transporting ATPase subunit epsilon
MASIHCIVSSPEGLVFEGDATSVVVPAEDGELGILPRHTRLVAKLGAGEVRIRATAVTVMRGASQPATGAIHYFVEGGFAYVAEDQVSVLATTALSLDTLRKADAQEEVAAVERSRPGRGAPIEELEAHTESLRVAKRKARLARG